MIEVIDWIRGGEDRDKWSWPLMNTLKLSFTQMGRECSLFLVNRQGNCQGRDQISNSLKSLSLCGR